MSHKRKNRSIITFPTLNRKTDVKIPKTSSINSLDQKSGDGVTNLNLQYNRNIRQKPNSPTNSYSTTGSDFEGLLDLSNKLSGLSSSSSLSWSEDYELEITKKVQLELEKLDRAFQSIEEVPSPHDKEEIAEWKHFFPHLCILEHKTPTNSTENSEASSESEDETITRTDSKHYNTSNFKSSVFPHNKSSLINKRRIEERAQNFLNANRYIHTLPHKPRSLEIEKYLKISSVGPDMVNRKQKSQPILTGQTSKELKGDISPEYSSLPFITATPIKSHIRKPPKKNSRLLTLPPINSFRSVSATPRQASSKSMFVSLNFEKDSSAIGDRISLRNDLMKLFDFIPISNR